MSNPESPCGELSELFHSMNIDMAMDEEKRWLEQRKAQLFLELTKLHEKTKKGLTIIKSKVYLHQVERLERDWTGIQTDIIKFNAKVENVKNCVSTNDFETIVEIINVIIEHCFSANEQSSSSSSSGLINHTKSNVLFKPKLDVPLFDGNIASWADFKSLFDNLVHSAEHITPVSKLQFLRTRLKGEALSIVARYALTDVNYNLAYTDLVNRYDNKRRLGSYLLQQILQFKQGNLVSYLEKHRHATSELKALDLPSLDDFLLFELCYQNLPVTIQRLLDRELDSNQVPTLNELLQFIQVLARSDELRNDKLMHQDKPTKVNKTVNKAFVSVISNKTPKFNCKVCKGDHKLQICTKFLEMSIDQRIKTAKALGHCLNCLNWHQNACKSTCQCQTCGSKEHHTLLHQPTLPPKVETDSAIPAIVNSCVQNRRSNVLFGTLLCYAKDCFGKLHTIRAVIDSCSDVSIITSHLVKRLGLPIKRASFDVQGITQAIMKPKGCTNVELKSITSNHDLLVQAVILNRICPDLPSECASSSLSTQFDNLQLADPAFFKKAPIDMLLGADVFQDCLSDEVPSIVKGRPSALRTIFGWIIIGNTLENNLQSNDQYTGSPLVMFTKIDSLENLISRFWEQEHVDFRPVSNPEDEECESNFMESHYRLNGRYVVKIPFKSLHPTLGSNRKIAESCYLNLEKKFLNKPDLETSYNEFLIEYLKAGHMQVTSDQMNYILPHHAVFKASSTTKVRVVFDGSAKDHLGISLNDRQYAGPKLQANIDSIIMNFRFHQVAVTSDIKQMYRQILIHPADRHYQHILWRPEKGADIQEFELNTVTYGLTSSPYLAQRVLRQLAADDGENYPLAAHAIKAHCFMDDFCTGASTEKEAKILIDQLINLLQLGGFELRKWITNVPDILSNLPDAHCEKPVTFHDGEPGIKILGLIWEPSSDSFRYVVVPFNASVVTKRSVLSYIAKIHDTMGLLNPIIFAAKYFIQLLWLAHLDWDEQLDPKLHRQWTKFCLDFPDIAQIRIPRHIKVGKYRLIMFSDASEKGMAAVAYIQVESNNEIIDVRVVKAKSQVAPLKKLTINRLELGAAVLSAKLANNILTTIDVPVESSHFFTDSKTVLFWLRKPTHTLKIYEANRINQIHDLTASCTWRHISSAENPADLNSRGATVAELQTSSLWWQGPAFLQTHVSSWKFLYDIPEEVEEENCDIGQSYVTTSIEPNDLFIYIQKFSSYTKLLRVMAYVLRFIQNCKKSSSERRQQFLSAIEIKTSLYSCLRLVQHSEFSEEIECLRLDKPLSRELRKLTPFYDPDLHLLRVGGRLTEASHLPKDTRHPFLLRKSSFFSKLICEYYHKTLMHAGPRTTEATIRAKFWILALHSLVKSVINRCHICYKLRNKPLQPLMAQLPSARVTVAYAFESCALDLGGPFATKESNVKKSTIFKSYLCLFVCLKTRAVHLEMVTDLSTPALLLAFQRFCARRGTPSTIYSDCGTNLKGASRYLKECATFLNNNSDIISSSAAAVGTVWHFNAPHAPNFNGMAEAGIKSAKNLLLRQVGQRTLTFEEFSTLLCRIEAILNSRPITISSTDPNENHYLTPGHFITGRQMMSPPEDIPVGITSNYNERWKEVQELSQSFWRTWSKHYLHQLMQREKWNSASSNIQVGELVYVTGIQSSPLSWPLGKVEEVFPGKDGVVRVVKVKIGSSFFTRPVNKLMKVSASY